ncbi:hypothetical protein DSECCO2_593890 [anaerobic digester metagenome]
MKTLLPATTEPLSPMSRPVTAVSTAFAFSAETPLELPMTAVPLESVMTMLSPGSDSASAASATPPHVLSGVEPTSWVTGRLACTKSLPAYKVTVSPRMETLFSRSSISLHKYRLPSVEMETLPL